MLQCQAGQTVILPQEAFPCVSPCEGQRDRLASGAVSSPICSVGSGSGSAPVTSGPPGH